MLLPLRPLDCPPREEGDGEDDEDDPDSRAGIEMAAAGYGKWEGLQTQHSND